MKTLEEIKQAKQCFKDEFCAAFKAVGNNLSTGISKDNGNFVIIANLTNSKLKNILPDTYKDFKVIVKIIGEILTF